MSPRILRLRTELEKLEDTARDCHPEVENELRVLIEDMKAHLVELENEEPATQQAAEI